MINAQWLHNNTKSQKLKNLSVATVSKVVKHVSLFRSKNTFLHINDFSVSIASSLFITVIFSVCYEIFFCKYWKVFLVHTVRMFADSIERIL